MATESAGFRPAVASHRRGQTDPPRLVSITAAAMQRSQLKDEAGSIQSTYTAIGHWPPLLLGKSLTQVNTPITEFEYSDEKYTEE